jgi:CheY-like chemotaxis protein
MKNAADNKSEGLGGSPVTILIVDDDEDIADILEKYVSSMGNYRILRALSGKEALEVVENHTPDLVLLDIMMEDIDGTEVCRAIKSAEKTSHIPVIAVTVIHKVHEKRYREILDSGVDAYVEKPFDYSVLKDVILRVLEKD